MVLQVSLEAQLMMVYKECDNWVIWIVTDVIYVIWFVQEVTLNKYIYNRVYMDTIYRHLGWIRISV